MARLQKDTVDYFPHYCDASTRDTLTVLEGQFGNDGYVFWFKLLEQLGLSDGHFIDCSVGRKWQILCARSRVNPVTGVEIMVLLVEMGAIDEQLWNTNKIIWSQNFVDNVAEAYRNRKRPAPAKPLPTPHNLLTTPDNPITTADNPQTKLDYSKLNNTILDTNPLPPSTVGQSLSTEEVIDAYKKNITLNNDISEEMESELTLACKQYPPEWVRDAIHEACRANNPRWRYIVGILRTWKRYGKDTKVWANERRR